MFVVASIVLWVVFCLSRRDGSWNLFHSWSVQVFPPNVVRFVHYGLRVDRGLSFAMICLAVPFLFMVVSVEYCCEFIVVVGCCLPQWIDCVFPLYKLE